MIDLQDRRIVVTGAAGGNGEGIAQVLAGCGADVILGDVRDELGEQVAASIRDAGGRATYCHLDVLNERNVSEAFASAAPLHGLVNNAGILTRRPFLEMATSDFERVINVNLRGYFLCAREAARVMVAGGTPGAIVNICSTNAHFGTATLVHYGASKGGILAMSRALSVELAAQQIRVNSVSPGVIPTGLNADRLGQPEQVRVSTEATALKRLGTPRDVGHAAAFLLSDAASWITGTDLLLDGGEHAG